MNLTPAEQLLHTTVKLSTFTAGIESGSGTAFFYRVWIDPARAVVLLVTNKHVLECADKVKAILHVATKSDPPRPSGQIIAVDIELGPGGVVMHPDPNVDLCAIAISDLITKADLSGKPIFSVTLEEKNIPSETDWMNFDAIEEVVMVGCPRGIYDEANNLPIFRRGSTASALNKMYNGRQEFLVDMACFPGSSGSPVFISNSGGHFDRENNSYLVGASRLFFIGVLFAGPMVTNSGQIVFAQPPRIEVASMMHLGFVLRSTEMRVIESVIRESLASTTGR